MGWEPWDDTDYELVDPESCSGLVERIDSVHRAISACERELFGLLLEADAAGVWWSVGAMNLAHWLSIRYGIAAWRAHRWVAAARALPALPRIAAALESGELGVDNVVELTRFATPETEERLVAWAHGVSPARIRERADREARTDAAQAERSRRLDWWYHENGTRFGMSADLPAAQGAVVARAIERVAEKVPAMPGEQEQEIFAEERRADALVALCSARLAEDPDPDRATVVVHVEAERLGSGDANGELESGGIVPPETVRRLLCDGRAQVVVEDAAENPVRVGRMMRQPPAWMLRQLRHRDRECRFPGCGARAFIQAHHIVWWEAGGRTDLENLVLVCSFHHRLVHEHGWSLSRAPDGTVRWFHPDGTRYRAGPSPPSVAPSEEAAPGPIAA